jgi:hypothetical protein
MEEYLYISVKHLGPIKPLIKDRKLEDGQTREEITPTRNQGCAFLGCSIYF